MHPNIEESNMELALINKQIDEIKKQIAIRKMQTESVPQPKTNVGWASYIMNDDRGLLDKYQDAERAWYNKLADQEHANKLAEAQHKEQATYQMDDNMKNRSLAVIKVQAAEQALQQAKNAFDINAINKAQNDLDSANVELAYWNKRTGITPSTEDKVIDKDINKDDNLEGYNIDTLYDTLSNIKSFKKEKDKSEALKKISVVPNYKQTKLASLYDTLSKIKSEETLNKELADELKKAQDQFAKDGTYDPKKFKLVYVAGKQEIVRK